MKKIIIGVIAVIIVLASILGIKQMKASKVREAEVKIEQSNKEAGVRPKQAELDDLIRNYRNIYVNLVNDKELDFSFLDNVMDKNSAYYKSVIEDITNKRKANIKLQINNIDVGPLIEDSSIYKIQVNESILISNGKDEDYKSSGFYIVKINDSNIKISDYAEK
ncbi:hypothetical protein JHL18_25020 [Clostridium sp. YIM B02505]|uniref:TcaA protein NTF2-like domain-containing protein n=1 Tax=Clostridium yunnanense TaxID=2800325 RepID=A0ABS1EWX4_9CLOT|nr:hypothetical protein [Clostridium yunnanense]MBK1813872.1 hypothetical protein [Clostridium yunnanense]